MAPLLSQCSWPLQVLNLCGLRLALRLTACTYLLRADIWGLDITIWVDNYLRKRRDWPRLHLMEADAYSVPPSSLGLVPESMDIVMDDALHDQGPNERLLQKFWPLVKPGGYYIIEDIEWERPSNRPLLSWLWHYLSPSRGRVKILETSLEPATQRILAENTAFFVDTAFGHRNFSALKRTFVSIADSNGATRPRLVHKDRFRLGATFAVCVCLAGVTSVG